ncbi:phosphopantetheine-binding protein [Paenibacillus sp. SI8]|uniref:phosphopantetheine-binding protein n=1 Tax=unclassified Paenibacillus TaxID=185978 RepID=UPI0034658AE4
MEKNTILSTLDSIIREKLQMQLSHELRDTDRIYEDLHIDSIMVLQLLVYIEEAFEISIPEEDVDSALFKTVGSLIWFIKEIQNEQKSNESASYRGE